MPVNWVLPRLTNLKVKDKREGDFSNTAIVCLGLCPRESIVYHSKTNEISVNDRIR